MKQYEAIGVVEAKYYTTALQLVDAMCKASSVEFLGSENMLGGRLVTTIVGGSIGSVEAAVEAAREVCSGREDLLKNAVVITRPHEEIMKFILKKQVTSTVKIPVEIPVEIPEENSENIKENTKQLKKLKNKKNQRLE